jgi:hypothetical protein
LALLPFKGRIEKVGMVGTAGNHTRTISIPAFPLKGQGFAADLRSRIFE